MTSISNTSSTPVQTCEVYTNENSSTTEQKWLHELGAIILNNTASKVPVFTIADRVKDFIDHHPSLEKYCTFQSREGIVNFVSEVQEQFFQMNGNKPIKPRFGVCLAENAGDIGLGVLSCAASVVPVKTPLGWAGILPGCSGLVKEIVECF